MNPEWQGELPYTIRLEADGTSTDHLGTYDNLADLRAWVAA